MPLDLNFLRQLFEEKKAERRQLVCLWSLAVASLIFFATAFYFVCVKAPDGFPSRAIVTVKENGGLNAVTEDLYKQKVIRSPFWFRALVILTSGQKSVLAGDYLFPKPVGVFAVVSKLTSGSFGLTPVKITFPEGITVSRMATILEDELVDFDTKKFLELAKSKEGYLFPDTYLFAPNVKPSEAIDTLQNNFLKKMETVNAEIKAFKKSQKDIVIMASIVEAEGRTAETRKIIAGILWKRLSIGMPLQVDAPFQYIIGKNTFQLTLDDLKYDSPYNTYKYKGLPPGAIGNPGLDAILATVTPTKTAYFYYLSDVRGGMHYAKTFEEHVLNKEKYLR